MYTVYIVRDLDGVLYGAYASKDNAEQKLGRLVEADKFPGMTAEDLNYIKDFYKVTAMDVL